LKPAGLGIFVACGARNPHVLCTYTPIPALRRDETAFARDGFKTLREKSMSDTLFGKIIRREIPADIVYEDDDVLAFRDINPQAPVHVLFIPKRAIATLNDVAEADAALIGNLVLKATRWAKQQGFADNGFRCVLNCNRDGGQTVFHLHLHLLAGRQMHWPPG
jgi:histidine triad (HIT) family protein